MNQDNKDEKEKSKKRKRVLLILLIILFLLIIGITFSFCHAGTGKPNGGNPSPSSQSPPSSSLENNGSALPGGYTPKSRQKMLSELREKQVIVTDKVSAQIAFSSGEKGSIGTWTVENPASNKVIEQCAVELDGRTVAESAPIYPNQHIEKITLSQLVSPGTYDVTAVIRYYGTDSKDLLGQAEYHLKLTVS